MPAQPPVREPEEEMEAEGESQLPEANGVVEELGENEGRGGGGEETMEESMEERESDLEESEEEEEEEEEEESSGKVLCYSDHFFVKKKCQFIFFTVLCVKRWMMKTVSGGEESV